MKQNACQKHNVLTEKECASRTLHRVLNEEKCASQTLST